MQALAADSVHRVLTSVLSSSEFASRSPPPLYEVIGKALHWIFGWLSPVLRWLFRDVNVHSPGLGVAERLAVLAAAGIGVWLLVRLLRLGWGALRQPGGWERRVAESDPLRLRSAQEWEMLARQASSAGSWREASLALYHAVVLRLAEQGHLRPSASKTAGDYRREVARKPGAADARDLVERVGTFLRTFERVAFAGTPPEADDYQRLCELAEPMGAHG